MKTIHKLKQSTSNFKDHFARDSKVIVAGTLFMFMLFGATSVSAVSYKIVYDDNVVSGMPEDVKSTTMNDKENISSDTPTREGYSFLKWCTKVPESDGTCSGTEYSAGAALSISGTSENKYKLYAMWEEEAKEVSFDDAYAAAGKTKTSGYYRMQDMSSSICATVTVGQTTTLIDNRSDNQTYVVAKLADGKCWMLDNLRLGGASTIALTPSNTNIASNYTLPKGITSGFNSYAAAQINVASKDTVPSGAMDGSKGSNKVGIYYNYCAASAGTYCYASGKGTGNASYDICPSNWRMPTGGSSGEYQALYAAYSSNATSFKTALSAPLSGSFADSSASDQGYYGFFWSSTYGTDSRMFNLFYSSNGIDTANHSPRHYGLSVRCVAK